MFPIRYWKSHDLYEQYRAGYRPPIVVGDSPPYGFYAEFLTFYDAIIVGRWTFILIIHPT